VPVEPYPTVVQGGNEFWEVPVLIPKESDPDAGVYLYVGKPLGGVGNFGPLVQGDPGPATVFQRAADLTMLDPDDPTPDSFEVIEVSPPTGNQPQKVKLAVAWHKAKEGPPGNTTIDLSDFAGTPQATSLVQVNAGMTGLEFTPQKVGDRYVATAFTSVVNSTTDQTLYSMPIEAQKFAWRASQLRGSFIYTTTNASVCVDAVARLQSNNNVVDIGYGIPTLGPFRNTLAGPPPSSAVNNDFDLVPAGQPAVILFRAERRAGSDGAFSIPAGTMTFEARVAPVL
jgi:hypothetical protein